MRKELTDQAATMARERVQYLGEELRGAGLLPAFDDDPPPVTVVRKPGRHARGPAGPAGLARLTDRLAERVPFAAPHLTVLVAVAAVVLVVIAWLRISASADPVPVPQAHTSSPFPATTNDPTPGSGAGSASGSPSPSSRSVVVDVAGKVHRPGVVTLPTGSRVIDAIRKAGGPRGRADLSSVNLARVLVDGEQILIGSGPAPAAASASGTGAEPAGGTVSLNQATLEQLQSLPGVGPVTAQKILDYRTAHGAFGSVDELLDVDGIGDKTLAELAPHLSL